MVKIMEEPIKLDDLGGFPLIFCSTPMYGTLQGTNIPPFKGSWEEMILLFKVCELIDPWEPTFPSFLEVITHILGSM